LDLIKHHRTQGFLCKTAALKLCAEKQEIFNFFSLYWCSFEGNHLLLALFCILAIFLIFKYTAMAVDEYIAEGITEISEWLNFSETLAAVTLLAFANGAGDVITALVASGTEGGISYNIGALFGAGMFVCAVVVAICIFQSEEEMVFDKMIIYRDIGIYWIATVATICFAWYGKITWWSSVILLLLYVALVVVVIVQESGSGDEKELKAGEEGTSLLEVDGKDKDDGKKKSKLANLVASQNFMDMKEKMREKGELPKSKRGSRLEASGDSKHMNKLLGVIRQVKYTNFIKKKLDLIKHHREMKFEDMEFSEQIFEISEWPFLYILYLTVLPATEEQYSKLRCLVWSFPGTFFSWYIFHPTIDWTYLYIALPTAFVFFLLFAFTLPNNKEPPSFMILLTIGGVIGGLMWSYLLIGSLIDLLELIGVVQNLDETFLGLTILAIGNALPDALTTVALCKQGAGVMAISGGYAGQLFGYLVGFGISMLKLTWKKGPQNFGLFDMKKIKENLLDLAIVGIAFLILSYTFLHGVLNDFRMNKLFARNLMLIYGVFIVFAFVVAIKHSMGH
jgi:sodium/potassium/calcium exchanger 6